MVDLAMSIFEFLTKFLIFRHPWHPWVCIRSDLKPLFETDISDSSYCGFVKKPINFLKIGLLFTLFLQKSPIGFIFFMTIDSRASLHN